MEKFVNQHDFRESFTLEVASALIVGIGPSFHPNGSPVILERMKRDALAGKLNVENDSVTRAEIVRWLGTSGLESDYQFDLSKGKASGDAQESQMGTKERNTLLTIIAVLCNEAKIDYTKPAKAANMIVSTAATMGISIGETTIEGHLKKIPDALGTRMK